MACENVACENVACENVACENVACKQLNLTKFESNTIISHVITTKRAHPGADRS